MKTKHIYQLLWVLAVIMFLGCTDELGTGDPDHPDEAMITLSMKLPARARVPNAITPSPEEENEIASIDILCLTENNGKWVYDYLAENIQKQVNSNDITITARVREKHTPQQFVIIINASDELSSIITSATRFEDIEEIERALVCNEGGGEWPARNNGIGEFRPIPMYTRTGAVTVSKTNNSIGNYNLIRMLARIDVTLKDDIDISKFKLAEACLFNYKTAGYVSYGFSGFSDDRVSTAAVPTTGDHSGTPIKTPTVMYKASETDDPRGDVKYAIYTYESQAIESQASYLTGTALVVGGYYDGDMVNIRYYRIDLKTTDNATKSISSPLLRNHAYHVEIQSVDGSGYDTPEEAYVGGKRIDVEITEMDLGGEIIYDEKEKRYLWLSDSYVIAEAAAKEYKVTIETDAKNWTAIFSDSPDDAGAGLTGNWINITDPIPGNEGTHNIKFKTTNNPNDDDVRIAYLHITADNRVTSIVTVEQAFVFDISLIEYGLSFSYVGAFWKADQTGERLIRITQGSNPSITGAWKATVVEGREWIILDTEPTEDLGVTWNDGTQNPADMLNPDNDAQYHVKGSARSVNGNCASGEQIYFRIGLTSKYTPTGRAPARYGVIKISYGYKTGSALIFVRQGHDADYLMRPQDQTEDGTLWPDANGDYRPLAAKISPYNLTAENYRNNPEKSDYSLLVLARRGVFTLFPSQGGAFFKYATNTDPMAWSPYIRYISGWTSDSRNNFWWSERYDQETCPFGYRRFTNGPTGAPANPLASQSEAKQSFWLNPPAGQDNNRENIMEGYYADGWFDRHAIVSSTNGTVNSAVSVNTTGVAYRGTLFYNPYNFASIFFPYTGYRIVGQDGALQITGRGAFYWTSSSFTQNNGWYLRFMVNDQTKLQTDERHYGFPIRCVKD